VVSRGERRPIARSGARSEAVPRARSGTSSLTVGRSPTQEEGHEIPEIAELSTKLELRDIKDFILFFTQGQAQRSVFLSFLERCDSEKYKIL